MYFLLSWRYVRLPVEHTYFYYLGSQNKESSGRQAAAAQSKTNQIFDSDWNFGWRMQEIHYSTIGSCQDRKTQIFLWKKEAQKPKRIVIRIWNKCTNRLEICLSKMKISKVRISFFLLILILIFFDFALQMFSTLIVWKWYDFFHDFLLIVSSLFSGKSTFISRYISTNLDCRRPTPRTFFH